MNTLSLKTVKILSQKINFDWIHPYKNETTSKSIGSGFFIDNQGHILTCSHVVEVSQIIYIEIPSLGDEKIEVEIINICPELDIALLKTKKYKNKEFYDLHEKNYIYDLKPGVDVFAVGFPLGQDNIKFTKGIISGRENSLIQTDAPINPGNSGGPLLLDNKVIGINSSGIMLANNIGYAVPIEYFFLIKKELFKKTTSKIIRRPILGISIHNTNEALLLNSRCKTGAYVKNIIKNSPISKTGIKQNDILCSINNIKIDNYGLFEKEWFNEKMKLNDIEKTIYLNDIVSIEYSRKNKLYKKNFKLTDYQFIINKKYPLYENYKIDYLVFGGFILMELTMNILNKILEKIKFNTTELKKNSKYYAKIISYLDETNRNKKKIIITHVFPNSTLNNLSVIKNFDIIDTINGNNVETLKDVRNSIKKNRKILEIVTETNNKVVLDIKTLFEEENTFSETYKYTLSDIYKFFKKTNKRTNFRKNSNKHKTLTKRKIKVYRPL